MPKRGYGGDILTGGTRDVNPQFLTFNAVQSAADTTTTTTTALPIQRLPTTGKSQIMEVLKVILEMPSIVAIAAVAESVDSYIVYLTTKSFGTTAITGLGAEPTIFASYNVINRGAFTAAGTYNVVFDKTKIIDLTDGAGHGILVATDNIFTQIQSAGSGVANTVGVKIMYRMKNVALAEYIGIVQSQQ